MEHAAGWLAGWPVGFVMGEFLPGVEWNEMECMYAYIYMYSFVTSDDFPIHYPRHGAARTVSQ